MSRFAERPAPLTIFSRGVYRSAMDQSMLVYVSLAAALGLAAMWLLTRPDEPYEDDQEEYDEGGEAEEGFTDAMLGGNGLTTSTDLLPRPTAAQAGDWAEFAPEALTTENLLDSTRFVGENTMNGQLRNANWDLRGTIPIAKQQFPFWNSPLVGDTRRAIVP